MKKKEVVRELNYLIKVLSEGESSLSLNNWVVRQLDNLIDDIEEG